MGCVFLEDIELAHEVILVKESALAENREQQKADK
jgi:hypothetical protein